MSELTTYFGPLGSGKSGLLQMRYADYQRQGLPVLAIKPEIDTKTGSDIGSRNGQIMPADFLIPADMTREQFLEKLGSYAKSTLEQELGKKALMKVFIEEAQFMAPGQVEAAHILTAKYDIPVECYGISTDFRTQLFDGARRLYELSDEVRQMSGICRCGEATKFNARTENGEFVFNGDSIAMQGQNGVDYVSLCKSCYIDEADGKGFYGPRS